MHGYRYIKKLLFKKWSDIGWIFLVVLNCYHKLIIGILKRNIFFLT